MIGRLIEPNKSCRIAPQHISLAVESQEDNGPTAGQARKHFASAAARCWRVEKGCMTRLKMAVFKRANEPMDWISRQVSERMTTWIWMYRAGECLTYIRAWDWLDDGRLSIYSPAQQILIASGADMADVGRPKGYMYLADPPVIISGWLCGRRVYIVDTRNWTDKGWTYLSEWTHTPIDTLCGAGADNDCAVQMAKHKAEIVTSVAMRLCSWVKGNDLGVMKPTIAGQAQQHWRHIKERPRVIKTVNQAAVNLERAGLFGTRADLFFRGAVSGPIYALDVNGCHGSIMSRCALPICCLDHTDAPDPCAAEVWAKDSMALATVSLDTKTPYPCRTTEYSLIWPIGRYTTTLCGPELERAVRRGDVVKWHKLSIYKMGDTCKKFAEYWQRQRQMADDSCDRISGDLARKMPQGLYGKFAQTRSDWIDIGEIAAYPRFCAGSYFDAATGLWHPFQQIAGRAQIDIARELRADARIDTPTFRGPYRRRRVRETRNSFPAISAWITACVRVYMDDIRAMAGERNVLYQCHDCIHVNSAGLERLGDAGMISDSVPGKLKLKEKYDSIEYYGVNVFRADGILKAAGLPAEHTEQEDGRIDALCEERLASILSRMPDGTVRMRYGEWTVQREYRGGVKLADGWIAPHILEEY